MVFQEYVYDKFVFKVKDGIYYHKDGCWIEKINNTARIGVTDLSQAVNGDIASVDLSGTGVKIMQGGDIGSIETMKVSFTLTSPASGKIIEHNKELASSPESINLDPYSKGWLLIMELDDFKKDKINLMDSNTYFDFMKSKISEESERLKGNE